MTCHSVEVGRYLLTKPGAPRTDLKVSANATVGNLQWTRPEYVTRLKSCAALSSWSERIGLGTLPYHPVALRELNSSYASFGLAFLCTTALIAAIIAFGASDWKMLRPMSTPAAPCCTAL